MLPAISPISVLTEPETLANALALLIFSFGDRDGQLQLPPYYRDVVLDGSDRVLGALGILAGVAGKISDVLGHDRKALAEVSRARSFDGSVDREQVGLDGHHPDAVDDLIDFPADGFQSCNHLETLSRGFGCPHDAVGQARDGDRCLAEHFLNLISSVQ